MNDISKPSVPEFTVKFADNSYDVPPTYEIDEFTGENVTKQEGYHVDNRSIVFNIGNQPFTPYNDTNGNEIGLYYNFRFKGHFGSEWRYYPFSETGQSTCRYSALFYVLSYESPKIAASNSEFTTKTLSLPFLFGVNTPTTGSQVDFQVQALIGHIVYWGDGFYSFEGQRSGWSDTQTLTVGEETSVTTPDDTATPDALTVQDDTTPDEQTTSYTTITSDDTATSNEQGTLGLTSSGVEPFAALLVIATLVAALAIGLLVYKKRKH